MNPVAMTTANSRKEYWLRRRYRHCRTWRKSWKYIFFTLSIPTSKKKGSYHHLFFHLRVAEPHSSVGSVADLRTRGRWFDPRLSQYPFRGLLIVIATTCILLSPLSVVPIMVMWESSHWLGKNIVRSTGKKKSRKAWIGALDTAI